MSFEATLITTIKSLVANRMFPDVAPELTPRPYITYQQVGGAAINFLDPTVPAKRRARVQISIWGDTRAQVSALAGEVEDALRVVTALQTVVEASPIATYEPDTKLYGSMQDFSFLS